LGTAKRLLRQEQDAEDAFQAVFLALAQGAAAIRHKEALAAWLHQAAERTACSILRNNRRWGRNVNRVQEFMQPMVTNLHFLRKRPSAVFSEIRSKIS
jgi:DNA-directed RNA polymerase specialized sigma24 family protein